MSTLSDEFSAIFHDEHRQVRDLLLELIDAFTARDHARIGPLLERTAALTGPHFRYEEEALYPALTTIFEPAYIDHLLQEHDDAIARAHTLVQLAQQETLSDDDVSHAVRLIRQILPHVSDCDGLSIMVETLPQPQVQTILDTREQANTAPLDLLTWATTVRGRPTAPATDHTTP